LARATQDRNLGVVTPRSAPPPEGDHAVHVRRCSPNPEGPGSRQRRPLCAAHRSAPHRRSCTEQHPPPKRWAPRREPPATSCKQEHASVSRP
jgi:hypothetical protein